MTRLTRSILVSSFALVIALPAASALAAPPKFEAPKAPPSFRPPVRPVPSLQKPGPSIGAFGGHGKPGPGIQAGKRGGGQAFMGHARHLNDHDLARWRGGGWHHEWHDGRYGWWWEVDGERYWYPQPVYPYPVMVSDTVVDAVDSPPPVVAYSPPVQVVLPFPQIVLGFFGR